MENRGGVFPSPHMEKVKVRLMYKISDIIADIDRGCAVNNMVEDCFSYRIIVFVREGNRSSKHYIDTTYDGLRGSLENFIKEHLSLTNRVVVAQTTVLKNGKCVCLQSRSYPFSLDEYFERIGGEYRADSRRGNIVYGRYAVR